MRYSSNIDNRITKRIAIVILIVVLSAVVIARFVIRPLNRAQNERHYDSATVAMKKGDFVSAALEFKEIDWYKDSSEQYNACLEKLRQLQEIYAVVLEERYEVEP